MYLTPTDKYWAIDIEGDLIPSTRVWCLCAEKIIGTETWRSSDPVEIFKWISERLAEGCKFIGHNIIGYDAPTLNRILKTRLRISDIIDTMILSMLYSPSLSGGHSLEAWGERLRFPKGAYTDFTKFTPEMLMYCARDTLLCKKIYLALISRMTKCKFTNLSIEIEHTSWMLIEKQKQNGFAFNIQEAHVLYSKIRELETDIEKRVHEIWPPVLKKLATYQKPFKKNGEPTRYFQAHTDQYEKVVISEDNQTYDCYGYVSFNIGSADQRIEKLLEAGWVNHPSEVTKGGKPKATSKGKLVPSLEEFVASSNNEGPKHIANWMELNARGNMINTWINAYNNKTGCIHGSLWLANTLRYRHSDPNTANIPAVRVGKDEKPLLGLDGVFTYEARNLWTTRDPEHRRIVGVDAKGIQLRVLAHHLNNPKFTEAVLSGDPHSYNQQIGGFATRAIAKTFI